MRPSDTDTDTDTDAQEHAEAMLRSSRLLDPIRTVMATPV
jgi:hypothetical protein